MNHSMPGLPVHHQLPESTQTRVHWVGDAIQPSDSLPSPSSPAVNLSHHQGLIKGVSSSHQVAKVLEFQLQHQSFQWTPRTDLLYDGLVGSPCSPRDSQESSPTPQLKSINSSALSFLYSATLTSTHDHWEIHSLDNKAEGSYPAPEVRGGRPEELPRVQGKEQRLSFDGTAVKGDPASKGSETQVRWLALREGIGGRQTETTVTDN